MNARRDLLGLLKIKPVLILLVYVHRGIIGTQMNRNAPNVWIIAINAIVIIKKNLLFLFFF